MQYINKDINSIIPDKNQPRKTSDPVRIHEMAKSILTEGVINPIEIDENNVIVTGEMRWRAAKEAGLKEIPCKIVHFEGRDRFRRQVVENIHHNTMTTMDTAEALDELLRTPSEVHQGTDAGISKMAREIGKDEGYIRQHLSYLKEKKPVREWLRKPDSKKSFIRETNHYAPEEVKDEIKDKIIKGELNNYRIITELSKAIKKAPEKKEELLSIDWSKAKDNDVGKIREITQIVEVLDEHDEEQKKLKIITKINEASLFFKETHPDDISDGDLALLKVSFDNFVELGKAFFLRKNNEVIKGELA